MLVAKRGDLVCFVIPLFKCIYVWVIDFHIFNAYDRWALCFHDCSVMLSGRGGFK